ncbi:MAG: hypothetical protein H6Q36_1683 [Chloroflexi bacterium]|nr:hypothetical protein [Chloroflexota bacterium]
MLPAPSSEATITVIGLPLKEASSRTAWAMARSPIRSTSPSASIARSVSGPVGAIEPIP